jgi:hypothetical protein
LSKSILSSNSVRSVHAEEGDFTVIIIHLTHAVAMPSMSPGLSPASAIALSAASACNWICEVSRMTPSRVVSAVPTMAMRSYAIVSFYVPLGSNVAGCVNE